MKRVMLIALMAIFSTVMFAQTKTDTKTTTTQTTTTHKKKSHTTEVKVPAKETKPAAQPTTVKKSEPAAPVKK
jgi:uncharacterized protein YdeI (BOF family)